MNRKLVCILACSMLVFAAGCLKKTQDKTAESEASAVVQGESAPIAEVQVVEVAEAVQEHVHGPGCAHGAHGEQAGHDPHAGHNHGPHIAAPTDVSHAPADAQKTASGLAYKKLKTNEQGRGIQASDLVEVHYTGWTTDGHMFDTSRHAGKPALFTPNDLIPGMKEALLLAKTGEILRVWIPAELAYAGQPGAPQGTLVFEFEIADVVTPVMPPNEPPQAATVLPSGIAYHVVRSSGSGKSIGEEDFVSIEFVGWTQKDGNRFHSSREIGEELKAPVSTFFPGWKEVLPRIQQGDLVHVWVPQALGISPEGADGLEGTLIFELMVSEVFSMPTAPADVAAPPADAIKTASGLASKVLTAGTGTAHPKATSQVKVNYSGWTTDGMMFDSSVLRGEPAVFPLYAVIAGWTEGVQLMVVGEKRRFWIPEALAYQGAPGAPQGMLVFDVELLEIVQE